MRQLRSSVHEGQTIPFATLTKESGRRNNVDEGERRKERETRIRVRVPLLPPVYIFFGGSRPHFCATHYTVCLLRSLSIGLSRIYLPPNIMGREMPEGEGKECT